ncbi:MAG: helicase C-terminal domain-containing protein [Candidatus Hermodarchaeota archaeon]
MVLANSIDIFPFTRLKPGQGVMLHYLSKKRRIIVQAPTGAGKTAVALSAMLPELSKGKQLIIATRTKSQIFDVFFKKLQHFRGRVDLDQISYVPLIAEHDLCVRQDRASPFDTKCRECPKFRPTKHPSKAVLIDLTKKTGQLAPSPNAWRTSLSEEGCPYHLVKRLCAYVDIVFTSQGHLSDPHLRKELFRLTQADTSPHTKLLLLDEIHGLVAPSIVDELPLKTFQEAVTIHPFEGLVAFLSTYRYPGEVQRTMWAEEVATYLDKDRHRWTHPRFQPLVALYKFLQSQGDCWVRTEMSEETIVQVNPFPDTIFKAFKHFYKVIGMSGTLVPLAAYQELFGIQHYQTLEVPRPLQNHFLAVTSELRFSSAHENHNQQTYYMYAQAILKLHVLNPCLTLVACASHELKDELNTYLNTPYVEDPQYAIPPWLSELQRKKHELVLAVMGGRLTEGLEIIDPATQRSKITLTIIVGLPFPVQNTLQDYLTYLYSQCYSAYQTERYLVYLPTLSKLLQTLGRGIRSERDYSAAVVLDYRADQFPLGRHTLFYGKFDVLLRDLFRFYHHQGK